MNTFERVRSVVARTLDRDEAEIGPETSLKNDIATDSLEDVEILLALEQEFCMDLGDDVAYMTTVQQIVDHIEGRLGGRSLVLEESVS
ncbi:MAG TPA: phosphopantetheine-binding protein [Chthonomonadaceae bacterium]|nr:phosphopantetheine-binding protein [Chthonomonadaceae bacterium]